MKILKLTIGLILFILVIGILLMYVKNKTTPDGLGIHDGTLAPMPASPNAVSSMTYEDDKYVEPLIFKEDLETSKSVILEIIEQMGQGEIMTNEENYIHVVFSTDTMKFKDDVEFYFDEKARQIHYRSASRVGYSDMGVNRERYETIKSLYYNE